jgi:hypothetical protein
MIIGRPIITINPLYHNNLFIYWNYKDKSTIEININEDLKKAVVQAIEQQEILKKESERVIKEKLGDLVDGKAYERVVDLIYKTSETSETSE